MLRASASAAACALCSLLLAILMALALLAPFGTTIGRRHPSASATCSTPRGNGAGEASALDGEPPRELLHFAISTVVLATAGVLELLQWLSSLLASSPAAMPNAVDREVQQSSAPLSGALRGRRLHEPPRVAHDSVAAAVRAARDESCLMLFVYVTLFAFYGVMAYGSFGLVHEDMFANGRPVYTLRYIEWSVAVPILMVLARRKQANSDPNATEKLGAAGPRRRPNSTDLIWSSPAIWTTFIYIYSSWLALVVTDKLWRHLLIFWSFIAFFAASWDQLSWTRNATETSTGSAMFLLLFQIILFGAYGVVFLGGAYELIGPVLEQGLYTFGDAFAKVGHSAMLLALRRQEVLTALCECNSRAVAAEADAKLVADDLARLVDTANAPIVGVDRNLIVTLWNRKVASLTGVAAEAAVGVKLEALAAESSRAELVSVLRNCLSGEDTKQFNLDLTRPNNVAGHAPADEDEDEDDTRSAVVPLVLNATLRSDAHGGVIGVVCVGQDLTDVMHHKAIEQRKTDLMAVVSHELRSPLHGVIGLATGLEKTEPNEARKTQLTMIKSCSTRLLDLVVSIMDMSALASGKDTSARPLNRSVINLPEIIDEVVALVQHATDKSNEPLIAKGVMLASQVQASQTQDFPVCYADVYKLTQVLYNLVTNACKFTKRGTITITARHNTKDAMVEVSIADTGVGIAPTAIKRIFEPFEQENNSEARAFEGIGLGLAISRAVVRQHGGEIVVTSKVGAGSTFTVRLPTGKPSDKGEKLAEKLVGPTPRKLVDLQQDDVPQPAIAARLHTGLLSPRLRQHAGSSRRGAAGQETALVLSVDDSSINHEVIKAALSESDGKYEVRTAMDGLEALRFFETSARLPDVVLLDVMMPGMTGFEVCTAIREEYHLSPALLPIIMLSARSPIVESVIEGLRAGSNDYITKPFDLEMLRARVRTALQVKRLHEIELEHAQYSNLLSEIMPPAIVSRLLAGERMIADSHDSVTILFADIVGWTNIAESVPTTAVITLLNSLFSAFDALTERHDVYKVETIGDCYMVAAGHDEHKEGHAQRVLRMALDMLGAVKQVPPPSTNLRLQIRVGVHTGPAHTGVVGLKVPRFCFFGDTINVASRMESSGLPSCVHISRAAALSAFDGDLSPPQKRQEAVLGQPGAKLVARGSVQVKGKGEMETFVIVPAGMREPTALFAEKAPRSGDERPVNLGQSFAEDGELASVKKALSSAAAESLLRLEKLTAITAERDELLKRLTDSVGSTASELAMLRNERDVLQRRAAAAELATGSAASAVRVANADCDAGTATPTRPNPASIGTLSSLSAVATAWNASSAALPGDFAKLPRDVQELQLLLAVKCKALERARRELVDRLAAKDLELDEKEMELALAVFRRSESAC